jgi:hypothetical protein
MHAIESITDQITLVLLTIGIWSGRKKLRPEDLKLGTEVPPEDLVSLGSKRVCNPEPLKIFHRIKKGAERACLHRGTRFLGGFAIPNGRAETLADELEKLKGEFEDQSRQFLRSYDQGLDDWIGQHPQWAAAIRRAIEPAHVVGGRLRFGYHLIQIAPADTPGTLEEEVKGLGTSLFAEVAQMARDLDDGFLGKEVLRRSALTTFRGIREKLNCLSFVDRRIQPIVDTIDDWFRRLPDKGPISGGIFNEGWTIASILGDPDKLARHGAGQLSIQQGLVGPEEDETEAEAQQPQVDVEPEPIAAAVHVGPVPSIDEDLDAWFGRADDPMEDAADAYPDALPSISDGGAEGAESDQDLEPAPQGPPGGASFYWGDEKTPGEASMPPLAPTQSDGNRPSFYFD